MIMQEVTFNLENLKKNYSFWYGSGEDWSSIIKPILSESSEDKVQEWTWWTLRTQNIKKNGWFE